MATSGDQCALGPDGKLLDAGQIDWYEDKDTDHPMPRANSFTLAAETSE